MTVIAAPSANQVQNTLAASYTRGTDTTITLVDGALFPSPTPLGHVIWIRDTFNFGPATKWCLIIYTSKATHVLTMGGGATDYALAKNVTVGDEAYEWPIGSYVELVSAADEIARLFARNEAALHDDIAGEIVAVDLKSVPIGADVVLIEDTAAGNAKKRTPLSAVPGIFYPITAIIVYEQATVSSFPHTATVDSVAGDVITLTAAVADLFWEDSMDGNSYAKIKNSTRTEYAWIKGKPDTDELQVTVAADIAAWQNADAITTDVGIHAARTVLDPSLMVPANAKAIMCRIGLQDTGGVGGAVTLETSAVGDPDIDQRAQVANNYISAYPVIALHTDGTFVLGLAASGADTVSAQLMILGYYI